MWGRSASRPNRTKSAKSVTTHLRWSGRRRHSHFATYWMVEEFSLNNLDAGCRSRCVQEGKRNGHAEDLYPRPLSCPETSVLARPASVFRLDSGATACYKIPQSHDSLRLSRMPERRTAGSTWFTAFTATRLEEQIHSQNIWFSGCTLKHR